jgi:hypothetical protein
MKKTALIALAALSFGAAAQAADRDVRVVDSVGAWEVSVVQNDSCMAILQSPPPGGDSLYIPDVLSGGVILQIMNSGWHIPDAVYKVGVKMEGYSGQEGAGGKGHGIVIRLSPKESALFRRASWVSLTLGEHEHKFTGLAENGKAIDSLMACNKKVKDPFAVSPK